jgi:hypothetical protein
MQKYEKYIWTHEGPRKKGHMKVPKVLKKDEHMKAHKKKKNEMIAMSQNKKLERDHSYKRSIV